MRPVVFLAQETAWLTCRSVNILPILPVFIYHIVAVAALSSTYVLCKQVLEP